jgi:hypothetical protein
VCIAVRPRRQSGLRKKPSSIPTIRIRMGMSKGVRQVKRRVIKKRSGQGRMAISQLNHMGGAPVRMDKKTGKVRKGWTRSRVLPRRDNIT